MEQFEVDAVVIGAGVVGLAAGRALARRGQQVVVIEREPAIGTQVSSRNSEVIHAGIYYEPGSLKARLCVQGRRQLYAYCDSHGVPYRACGKWIVATEQTQLGRLGHLRERAQRNGVLLEPLGRRDLAAQPGLRAVAALASPTTGILDSHQFMLALQGDLEAAGGQLVLDTPLERASTEGLRHRLVVGGVMPCTLLSRRVVNAAGLDAPGLAHQWEGMPGDALPRQHLARGHYFAYSGPHPFQRLIYPLPEPGGLGVHLSLDMTGQARFGPDVEWVAGRDYAVPLERKVAFVESVRRWWPGLEPDRLQPAYAGIRPKISGPGEPPADFLIHDERHHGLAGLVHLLGIESPGLTASLALADEVADRLD